MRQRPARYTGAVLLLIAWCCCAAGSRPPLVDIDAERLRPGPLHFWQNLGTLQGAFEPQGEPPAVAMVEGRKAVTFPARQWLRSDFPMPADCAGGRPFTVAAWVYPARTTGRQVFLWWGGASDGRAEFGCGRGDGAAVSAGRSRASYARTPWPRRWHHFAIAYNDGVLRVYVDGEPDSTHKVTLKAAAAGPAVVAAAWDAAAKQPSGGFRGAIASVRIWDRELAHREIRNDMGDFAPFDPSPANGAMCEDRRVTLRWRTGRTGTSACGVYLGTERAAVEAMHPTALLAGLPVAAEAHAALDAGVLAPGQTYFWRIAQGADDGTTDCSPVWSFSISIGPAANPEPRDRVAGIPAHTRALSWKPGPYARSQTVHFGTDPHTVSRGGAVLAAGLPPTQTRFDLPAPLEPGRRYYWRVEQDNGELPSAPGALWAFRTADTPLPGHLTFFVVSDTHYGLDWRVEGAVQQLIDDMNFLPGTELPPAAGGGIVRTPRGVVHLGDMTNDGKEHQWRSWLRDFGLNGDGRLAYPVYELFGNHDGGASGPVRKALVERNPQRPGIAAISSNGVHYAMDWEGIRIVNVNISPGPTTRPYDPQNSIDFLRDQLRGLPHRNTPVIVLQHFGFDQRQSARWWPEAWRTAFAELVREYNMAAVFHGHDHETDAYRWNGIDVFDAPHIRDADVPDRPVRHGYFVVQIADGRMTVAERHLGGRWGLARVKSLAR